ncbi:DUF397 domain-containing protein [Streptomyces torulosus]|uniref:DUF397 domain-containing protein n=1 Tax=Streptomyces torulosus TaxID=68276 RepID=UPI0006EB7F6C|nr:DUF397 domain-containing protein [Streptomyces torulosus]
MAESDHDGRLVWFTSSYSNGAGGECVECATTDNCALVRDSKIAEGPVLAIGSEAWRSFVQAMAG